MSLRKKENHIVNVKTTQVMDFASDEFSRRVKLFAACPIVH